MFCFSCSIYITADCGVQGTRQKRTKHVFLFYQSVNCTKATESTHAFSHIIIGVLLLSVCCDSTTPNLGVFVAISALWQHNTQPWCVCCYQCVVTAKTWCFCGCQCAVTAKHPTLKFVWVSLCHDSPTLVFFADLGQCVVTPPRPRRKTEQHQHNPTDNSGSPWEERQLTPTLVSLCFCWPVSVCCDTANIKAKDTAAPP